MQRATGVLQQDSNQFNFFDLAAQLRAMGYSPVPLNPIKRHPPLYGWQEFCQRQANDAELRRWHDIPQRGLGLACGFGGLVAVDVDDERAVGIVSAIVPKAVVMKRGSKGLTAFYRDPTGEISRTRRFSDANQNIFVEILATGSNTTIPPTYHPKTCQPYHWIAYDGHAPSLFDVNLGQLSLITADHVERIEQALIEAGLIPAPPPPRDRSQMLTSKDIAPGRLRSYAEAALNGEAEKVEQTGEGGRNIQLFNSFCAVGKYVHHGALTYDEVLGAMIDACHANGLLAEIGPGDVQAVLDNGLRWSINDEIEMEDRPMISAKEAFANAPKYEMPPEAGGQRLSASIPYNIESNQLPPTKPELFKTLLPADAGLISIIGGQSGAGKSFYAVRLAVNLAAGAPLLGMPCREGGVGVVYIAAEAGGTIEERVFAAKQAMGKQGHQLPIAIITRCPDLNVEEQRHAMIQTIRAASAEMVRLGLCRRVGLVIIDTITTAFALEDENSSSEVTRICQMLKEIGLATGTVIAPVHHYGKSKDAGLRGSSAWRGMVDTGVSILADRNEATGEVKNRSVAILKDRNGVEGPLCCFDLQQVDLGINIYGEPRITCVFEKTEGDPKAKKPTKGRSVFDEAFNAVSDAHPDTRTAVVRDGELVLQEKDVREEFIRRYPAEDSDDPRKAKEAVRSAWRREVIKATSGGGIYDLRDGLIWKRQTVELTKSSSVVTFPFGRNG